MTKKLSLTLALFMALALLPSLHAQTINPVFYVITDEGEEEQTSYDGSAPLRVRFEAKPEGLDGLKVNYEWRFFKEGEQTAYLIRYEENTEFVFNDAGGHRIICIATYDDGMGGVELSNEDSPLTLTIAESQLDFPNAFSPNGDGINDTYKPKAGAKSIVEFNAAIFNRWGQMLFKFRDINDAWDGTYKGRPVKDGAYFLNCEAKGADGKIFRIRKDVNILRGYTEKEGIEP